MYARSGCGGRRPYPEAVSRNARQHDWGNPLGLQGRADSRDQPLSRQGRAVLEPKQGAVFRSSLCQIAKDCSYWAYCVCSPTHKHCHTLTERVSLRTSKEHRNHRRLVMGIHSHVPWGKHVVLEKRVRGAGKFARAHKTKESQAASRLQHRTVKECASAGIRPGRKQDLHDLWCHRKTAVT